MKKRVLSWKQLQKLVDGRVTISQFKKSFLGAILLFTKWTVSEKTLTNLIKTYAYELYEFLEEIDLYEQGGDVTDLDFIIYDYGSSWQRVCTSLTQYWQKKYYQNKSFAEYRQDLQDACLKVLYLQ